MKQNNRNKYKIEITLQEAKLKIKENQLKKNKGILKLHSHNVILVPLLTIINAASLLLNKFIKLLFLI